MLQSGPKKVDVTPGTRVVIDCDKEFTVYGYEEKNGKPSTLFGPSSATDRRCVFVAPDGVVCFEVRCPERAKWQVEFVTRAKKEVPDGTRVELGIPRRRPNSLAEDMKRFIREELSRQAEEQEFETFEEADDFDIWDEPPDPISRYEMSELQEEAEIPDADPPPDEVKKPSSGDERVAPPSPPPPEKPPAEQTADN